jgi:hypothetical protein
MAGGFVQCSESLVFTISRKIPVQNLDKNYNSKYVLLSGWSRCSKLHISTIGKLRKEDFITKLGEQIS